MQHWYDNLDVGEDGFSVTLNFGDAPEPLYIPYDSIKTFVDPSVEFGLRFESAEDEQEEDAQDHAAATSDPQPEDDLTPRADAEVVSLDSFRK